MPPLSYLTIPLSPVFPTNWHLDLETLWDSGSSFRQDSSVSSIDDIIWEHVCKFFDTPPIERVWLSSLWVCAGLSDQFSHKINVSKVVLEHSFCLALSGHILRTRPPCCEEAKQPYEKAISGVPTTAREEVSPENQLQQPDGWVSKPSDDARPWTSSYHSQHHVE